MREHFLNPSLKLLLHGGRVEQWLKTGSTDPILIEIAPVGYCNARCAWCFFNHNKSAAHIDGSVMLRALRDAAALGVKAINWTGGGEPSIHPEFADFVLTANELGLEQGLFTNSYVAAPHAELFRWIRISATDKGFDKVQLPNAPFGTVVNMRADTPLERLCLQARDMGARYFQVRPALVGHWSKQPKIDPPIYLKRYETDHFLVLLTEYKFAEATRPRTYSECYGHHFCLSVDWNGGVGVCLYRMHEDKYVFGNLNDNSLLDIWRRRSIGAGLVDDRCQNCCKNHEINRTLFAAKELGDVNFL